MSESKRPFPDKFTRLQPLMQSVVEPIKSDLKKHHLKKDPAFVRKNFSTTNVTKIPVQELIEVYRRELPETSEQFGEWLGQLWMMKHTDIYDAFERTLTREVDDFTAVKELPEDLSRRLQTEAVEQFGAVQTYIFVLINDVVLAPAILEDLASEAEQEFKEREVQGRQEQEERDLDTLRKQHERELRRLQDKYEKKFAGMEAKYWKDTERLRNENAALKQRLDESKTAQ